MDKEKNMMNKRVVLTSLKVFKIYFDKLIESISDTPEDDCIKIDKDTDHDFIITSITALTVAYNIMAETLENNPSDDSGETVLFLDSIQDEIYKFGIPMRETLVELMEADGLDTSIVNKDGIQKNFLKNAKTAGES